MYRYIFFDLDGTLTDPGEGITNSVMFALDRFGIKVADRSVLYPFIGPPLIESFEKYFGFSHEDAAVAVDTYREYYRTKGIFENRVYDGIPEVLKELKAQGGKIVLATLKPEKFALEILKHFNIFDLFDFASAARMDHSRETKGEIIGKALAGLDIADKSEVIMIGDRENDIVGAKENGIDSAGVLYGYGSREELVNAGAKYILNAPADIMKL